MTTNKLEMIMDYNRTKGGVETVDQKCSFIFDFKNCSRRSENILKTISPISNKTVFNGMIKKSNSPTGYKVIPIQI